jgi:hypothetical protein
MKNYINWMILLKIITAFGKEIALSSERWNHIVARHPEMAGKFDELSKTLAEPTVVIQSEGAYIYQREEDGAYLTIVIDQKHAFIITAFISCSIKRGDILWRQ